MSKIIEYIRGLRDKYYSELDMRPSNGTETRFLNILINRKFRLFMIIRKIVFRLELFLKNSKKLTNLKKSKNMVILGTMHFRNAME